MAGLGFAEVVLVTDPSIGVHLRAMPVDGLRVETIAPLQGRGAYSNYVLHKLGQHLRTPHALIFQWDGFVRDPSLWRDEFLDYDYVGALWPTARAGRMVGNGGFCLRSARLMAAVADLVLVRTFAPEDILICEFLRDRLTAEYGLRFAGDEIAKHFSLELMTSVRFRKQFPGLVEDQTFGFHGFFNFHLVFSDEELLDVVDNRLGATSAKVLTSTAAAGLLLNLAAAERIDAMWALAARMGHFFGIDEEHAMPDEIVLRCFGDAGARLAGTGADASAR